MTQNPSGKIQIYTGKGKGKTTASLGVAMRAIGAGKKVAIVFFDKGGTDYSERKVLECFKEQVDYWPVGRDRRTKDRQSFDSRVCLHQ